MNNPLIPADDKNDGQDGRGGFVLPRSDYQVTPPRGDNQAANVIRDKLDKIYASEPDALAEEQEAEAARHKSKHQRFMDELQHSGKDLAQIQTEWHNYYVNLPNGEKHEVWQEFYANAKLSPVLAAPAGGQPPAATPEQQEKLRAIKHELGSGRPAGQGARQERQQLQKAVRRHARGSAKLTRKQHFQSLAFGLGVGFVVVFIFLFGFFNEVIIAPFIQPGRTSADTPLIVSGNSFAPNKTPEVIIPKINVEIPVDYSETSTDEATIENDLESGVVHYPTTTLPGQTGNAAFFGHSSNNIFNPGRYKFAFVLLHTLVPGDTFYLTYHDKVYVYKIFRREIVNPDDVGILNPIQGHPDTATLITCDPPGTSLHRLYVVGDQISPNPSGNAKSDIAALASTTDTNGQLPGNGQTLWGRFISQSISKVFLIILGVGAVLVLARRGSRKSGL